MIKEFHLDPKDHAEVLRIHNLYSDRNEDNEYEMVKSNLREFKRLAKTYPFPSLFHSLKSKYFDIGVIERYKNGDLAKANYCLSMSARCGFLMDIIGGKDYSGGYDCLHVYSMLLAASCGDFACADRCLDVFPGPAKSGHLSSVILCNGLCDTLKRKSSMGLRGVVDKRKDTKYYMAMFNALIAIMDGSRPLFLSSVSPKTIHTCLHVLSLSIWHTTMTYTDLLNTLKKMNTAQLSKDVTILSIGEYYPAALQISDTDDDVLGPNHPYFKIEGES